MMKYFCILFIIPALGCLQTREFTAETSPQETPILIEINSVPPPFDISGRDPYIVWMNGRKVNLPKKDLVALVNKVGKENIPKLDPHDIHKGWLWPHYAKREEWIER